MSLPGADRLLPLARMARVIRVVVGKQPNARVAVDNPAADLMGHAGFGFERPAVVAKIDQLGRLVLSQRRNNGHARTDDDAIAPRAGELRWFQRWRVS